MLKLAPLAIAALTSLCVAQSPLTTLTGGTNEGNVGGGIYFNLQINTKLEITQIDFRCGSLTVAGTGTMDVYLGPSTYFGNVTNASLWTLVASSVTTVAPSAVSIGVLNTPICLEPGSYGIALKSNGYQQGYTNGTGCTSNTIPGSCTNSTFTRTEMVLRAGAAQNAFLTGPIFNPRIYNGAIHYNVNPACATTSVAAWERFGNGCYDFARSFYENWPNPASADLGTVAAGGSGITSIMMTNLGVSYLVTPGTAVVVAPTTPSLGITGAASLAITLDPLSPNVQVIISGLPAIVTNVEMSSEGLLTFNGTASQTGIGTVASFLAGPAAIGWYKNLDPSLAGASTHYEYSPTLSAHIFTWLNVPTNAGTDPNTIQIIVYDNGNIEERWGTMSQLGGGTYPIVVGFNSGPGSRDAGNDDLSVRLGGPTGTGFVTDSVDNAPVELGLSARPLLGTTPIFATTSMEPVSIGGILLIGFVGGLPGTSLLSFGMPGCTGYVDLAFSPASTFFLGNPGSIGFGIPNSPGLAGVQLKGQAVTLFSSFNSAFGIGIAASNGVNIRCGTL